jgi:hypothetical protein
VSNKNTRKAELAPQSVEEFNSSTGATRQHVQQQTQQPTVRSRIAAGRGTNISPQEVSTLLNLIDSTLPFNARSFLNIVAALYSIFPQKKRTDEGCRNKFLVLCNRKPRSGETKLPLEATWPRKINKIAQ